MEETSLFLIKENLILSYSKWYLTIKKNRNITSAISCEEQLNNVLKKHFVIKCYAPLN